MKLVIFVFSSLRISLLVFCLMWFLLAAVLAEDSEGRRRLWASGERWLWVTGDENFAVYIDGKSLDYFMSKTEEKKEVIKGKEHTFPVVERVKVWTVYVYTKPQSLSIGEYKKDLHLYEFLCKERKMVIHNRIFYDIEGEPIYNYDERQTEDIVPETIGETIYRIFCEIDGVEKTIHWMIRATKPTLFVQPKYYRKYEDNK